MNLSFPHTCLQYEDLDNPYTSIPQLFEMLHVFSTRFRLPQPVFRNEFGKFTFTNFFSGTADGQVSTSSSRVTFMSYVFLNMDKSATCTFGLEPSSAISCSM